MIFRLPLTDGMGSLKQPNRMQVGIRSFCWDASDQALQLHAARQQAGIGRIAQKALQHAFKRGIFAPVLHFLHEKIGDDLRLLLHVELG